MIGGSVDWHRADSEGYLDRADNIEFGSANQNTRRQDGNLQETGQMSHERFDIFQARTVSKRSIEAA